MNILIKTALFTGLLSAASVAMAECPTSMPMPYLEDCLVIEGAGDEYPVHEVMSAMREFEEKVLAATVKTDEEGTVLRTLQVTHIESK
jgi:hypothetical protein